MCWHWELSDSDSIINDNFNKCMSVRHAHARPSHASGPKDHIMVREEEPIEDVCQAVVKGSKRVDESVTTVLIARGMRDLSARPGATDLPRPSRAYQKILTVAIGARAPA